MFTLWFVAKSYVSKFCQLSINKTRTISKSTQSLSTLQTTNLMTYFETDKSENIQTLTTDRFDMKICLRENIHATSNFKVYDFICLLTVDKMLQCFCKIEVRGRFELCIAKSQPSPSRSEASARKIVDVVRDWDLGVTSPLKVLQNA
jgi:hypothetical protein